MRIYLSKNPADQIAVQRMVTSISVLSDLVKYRPTEIPPGLTDRALQVEDALKCAIESITRDLAAVAYWKN